MNAYYAIMIKYPSINDMSNFFQLLLIANLRTSSPSLIPNGQRRIRKKPSIYKGGKERKDRSVQPKWISRITEPKVDSVDHACK